MENKNLSLLGLLPNGKVENDVRIGDKTVTGICTVYLNRADDENAFFLRDIGVALLTEDNLSEAVRIAVDQACEAAIRHLAAVAPAAAQPPKQQEKRESAPVVHIAPPVGAKEPVPEKEDDYQPVDLGSILVTPGNGGEADGDAVVPPAGAGEPVGDGIERINFEESRLDMPASPESPATAAEEDVDPAYQAALDMEITIFGKLHECNGWKAGRILNQRPDVIVDFCQRNSPDYDGPKYSGPRVEQKEALLKLFTDAALKVQKAA